jgi:hypothetical protein
MTRTCPETNHSTTVVGSLRLLPMDISISSYLKPFPSCHMFSPLKPIVYVPSGAAKKLQVLLEE